MKFLRKHWIIIGSSAVILIFLSVFLVSRPGATEVEITNVQRGDLTATVSSPGVIVPVQEVQISSGIVGEITKLPVNEGDTVKAGDLLVQLEQSSFNAQVRQAHANLELAQASLAQSKAQWERVKQLFESELVSKQEMEAAQTQYRLDVARVKQARAALDQMLDQLEETTIKAPISGTITQLNVEPGEVVVTGTMNNPGTVLMTIADLSRMKVECDVDEADIAEINKGQPAIVDVDAITRRRFEGAVTEVGYAAQQDLLGGSPVQNPTVNYNVTVTIEGTVPILKPGMTAYVEIITSQESDILLVPIQAVVTRSVEQLAVVERDGNGDGNGADRRQDEEVQAVFVYDNGIARLVPVATGIIGEDYIQIVDGVAEGQEVITGPFSALRELESGERIEPEDE